MCEGYHVSGDDDQSGLDELLCEYVDGTMDPAVRDVFEEYLRANPELADHVARLHETRMLLCRYGCQCSAPRGLQSRLRRQLYCEMMRTQEPLFTDAANRLRAAASVTSAVAVFATVCMLAGMTLFADESTSGFPTQSASVGGSLRSWGSSAQATAIVLPEAPYSPMQPRRAAERPPISSGKHALAGTPVLFAFDSLRTAVRELQP